MAEAVDTLRSKVQAAAKHPNLELRQHCDRRKAAMIYEREPNVPDWMQVTEYIDPARGRFDSPSAANPSSSRAKKRSRAKIINSTATRCLRVAAAGFSSHMTSKSRPWFTLTVKDTALNKKQRVRVWLDNVTTIIADILAKSNFYKAMPVCYTEDLSYGVAVMLEMPSENEVIRFHPLTAGTFAIALNDEGKVDSMCRWYTRSARQLVQKYGKLDENGNRIPDPAKMPDRVCKAWKDAPDQLFTVESMFEPNPDRRPGIGPLQVQAPQYRPFREIVWISGTDTDKHGILDHGGHYEQPFICIRFNPVEDDVYSACPGVDTLGDIKQLQYLEGQKLRMIDLLAEPPLSIPDTMRNLGTSLAPRSKNFLPQSQTGAKVEATYTPDAAGLQHIIADIREVEARLKAYWFYDLFLTLDALGDQTGRTMYEVAERKDEKATVLGPTLEIVTDEGLDPTIIRTYKLAERAGLIPPPPEELNAPVSIEYTSILAQAMKASGTSGIERTTAFAVQLAKVQPMVLDKFDADAALDEYNQRTGAPASMVRDDEAVAAKRQADAAQQQQMAALAAAKPMADAAQAIQTLDQSVPMPGSLGEGLAAQLAGTAV